ncbi:zinc finger protein 706 isoform X1 [Corythoichthys intestinalis]|uniref:zinc finger protein 706 isoform X1 n=2 Tax=Corythoichthys intestinalis TaxID=161448 RepID=UPI0025A54052|nr:zinc finger protein 706 isoform X1 [Corythoichthys intestinalis]
MLQRHHDVSGNLAAVTLFRLRGNDAHSGYITYILLLRDLTTMARGQQKIQSQQKKAKKQAELKKAKGHDQKTAAKAALVFTCAVCRSQMPDPKTFKQHFESKHPKSPLPPELEGVEA